MAPSRRYIPGGGGGDAPVSGGAVGSGSRDGALAGVRSQAGRDEADGGGRRPAVQALLRTGRAPAPTLMRTCGANRINHHPPPNATPAGVAKLPTQSRFKTFWGVNVVSNDDGCQDPPPHISSGLGLIIIF